MREEMKKSAQRAACYRENRSLMRAAKLFMKESALAKYSYNFSWMGRMIIQYPEDLIVIQELIWSTKPDIIIETGTAHGGSTLFYASLLKLLGGGRVISIDTNVYPENKRALAHNPLSKSIVLFKGSSTEPQVIAQVEKITHDARRVLVALDSLHSHEHVLKELRLYAPFVSKGSYIIVFDTFIEDVPAGSYPGRPWDKGSNPKTAVWEFLEHDERFAIDQDLQQRLLVTGCPHGYLKRIE